MSGAIVIAAPSSGSGKTVLTLALLRHFRRLGMRIASAKMGPDYIDPGFHAAATGAACRNLDPWAMRPATLAAEAAMLERDAELVLCEGAMGLFDGIDARGSFSTAALAERLGWPVVLVVDVRGQSASVGALVRGFATHRPGLRLAGIILNRVGSARHEALVRAAVAAAVPDVRVLGAVPRDARLALPARHLGLVPAGETPALDAFLDAAADVVAAAIDVPGLIALAHNHSPSPACGRGQGEGGIGEPSRIALAPTLSRKRERRNGARLPPLGQRIAVARDAAFAFAYPSILDSWRAGGASLSFFSPLADEGPEPNADAVYLPGGYPELHAGILASAKRFRAGMAAAESRGAVVYGECGGYMVLGAALVDSGGARHPMLDMLPVVTSFAERRVHLGYREAVLAADGPLGRAGAAFRGHEFHYATIVEEGAGAALFETRDAAGMALGPTGRRRGTVMGSFVHLVDRADTAARAG